MVMTIRVEKMVEMTIMGAKMVTVRMVKMTMMRMVKMMTKAIVVRTLKPAYSGLSAKLLR